MFNTSIQNISSAATIMIGTAFLAVSTVAIVSPARADTPVGFQKSVQTSANQTMRLPTAGAFLSGVTTVAVSIDADGSVTSTALVRSSGVAAFDAEALRTAKATAYPATGKARSVALVLGFGQRATVRDEAQGKALVDAYRTDSRRLLATETTAQPAG